MVDILRWDICDPEITIYYYIATPNEKVPFRELINLANAKNLEGRGEATPMISVPNVALHFQATFI